VKTLDQEIARELGRVRGVGRQSDRTVTRSALHGEGSQPGVERGSSARTPKWWLGYRKHIEEEGRLVVDRQGSSTL